MLKYKIVNSTRKVLAGATCDRCGHKFKTDHKTGHWNPFGEAHSNFFSPTLTEDCFILDQKWGYFSGKDLQHHEAVVCEKCYDIIFKDVKIKIFGVQRMTEDKARAKRYKDNYNLTIDEYDKVDAFQGGICWLCGRPQPNVKGRSVRLSVDHSHETGLFRGLLCSICNRVFGKLENGMKRAGWTSETLHRIRVYMRYPPAVTALGYDVIGYKGRCGTKKHRAHVRREAKRKK